jgi:hypothetical protein
MACRSQVRLVGAIVGIAAHIDCGRRRVVAVARALSGRAQAGDEIVPPPTS